MKSVIVLLFVLLPIAAGNSLQASLGDFGDPMLLPEILTGCWEAEGSSESWGSATGGMMLGTSKTTKDGKVRSFEFLRIQKVEDDVLYVPYINGKQVDPFVLDKVSKDEVSFVNRQNDFPQVIHYRLEEEILYITLSSEEKQFAYSLERTDCNR